ncbi:NAAT1 protein, partial [Pseudoatta argentina]
SRDPFSGLGYSQAFGAFCVVSYYSALMALTLYYLVSSFQSKLPWSFCRPEWKDYCIDLMFKNVSEDRIATIQSSAELYFRKIVLQEYASIENGIGVPSWHLSICLFLSWVCVFGVLFRGVKSTGKAVYFLALFPYIVMTALLIRAVTLEGAVDGILFFVTPKWDALWKPTVWYAAITQCLFSLSVCFGPIINYSDVMIVTTLDTFTSLIAHCSKIYDFRQTNEDSSMPAKKSHSKERTARTLAIVKKAQALISDDPGQSLRKLTSIVGVSEPTMRRIAEKDLRYELYTSCSPRLPFWPPNSPDLNPLDYYVWSVVERVINKSRHPNVTLLRTIIEAAFIGSATLQRAYEHFRPRTSSVQQPSNATSASGSYPPALDSSMQMFDLLETVEQSEMQK